MGNCKIWVWLGGWLTDWLKKEKQGLKLKHTTIHSNEIDSTTRMHPSIVYGADFLLMRD